MAEPERSCQDLLVHSPSKPQYTECSTLNRVKQRDRQPSAEAQMQHLSLVEEQLLWSGLLCRAELCRVNALLISSSSSPPSSPLQRRILDKESAFNTHQERLWSGLFNKEQFLCILRCPLKSSPDISTALLPRSVDIFRLRKAICSAGMLCPCSAEQILSVKKSPSGGTGTWSQLMDLSHLLSFQFFLATASSPRS